MTRPELTLVLIGFGNVARRFVRLLGETAERLDFTWKVVGISTRHHGSVVDTAGIDTRRAITIVESRQSLDRLDPAPRERSGIDVIRQVADADGRRCRRRAGWCASRPRCSTSIAASRRCRTCAPRSRDRRTSSPPTRDRRRLRIHELEALAESVDRVFFFEGAVMDGVPVFNLVRETMPAITIEGFRGVINTTCNFILSELERGNEFDHALAEMQARGIAEADPTLDIEGWDAAAKTAALVNVLMGSVMTPHHVARTGIRDVTGIDVREAVGRNKRIRLVASAIAAGRQGQGPRRTGDARSPGSARRHRSISTTRCISPRTCSARSASCNAAAA